MFTVTWRGIRQHPVRFALSVLAVVLGIAFVSGTFSLRAMMASTFDDIISTSQNADAYIRGVPPKGTQGAALRALMGSATVPVSMSLADDAATAPGVRQAVPAVQGTLVLVGADGTAVASGQAPTIAFGAYEDPTVTAVAGRSPANSHEIALEAASATKAGLKVGDTTTIIVGDDKRTVTVVGIFDTEASLAGAVVVALDPATAEKEWAPKGYVSTIAVYGTPDAQGNVDEQALVDALTDALPTQADIQVVTGDSLREASRDAVNSILGFVGTFLLIFAAIALFVGGFIIANTFQMSVRGRMKEIAVLRAIGASPGQVFASVVGQAAIVGAVGAGIGVFAGLGLVTLVRAVSAAMGMELSGDIPLDATTVAVALVTGILVAVVSAALPARQAASIPPVDAMREGPSRAEKPLTGRGVVGAALVAVGIVAVWRATGMGEDGGPWLGIGAGGILLGMLLLGPVMAPTAGRILSWPFVMALKPLGSLARGNVVRNPRRTANTASALMIGMALVGAATVLASSTQASVRGIVDNDVQADFVLQGASQEIPGEAADAVDDLASVGRADRIDYGYVQINGRARMILSTDAGFFTHSMDVPVLEGDTDALDRGELVVPKSVMDNRGWRYGQRLTLTSAQTGTDDGGTTERRVRIGAVIDSSGSIDNVVLPASVYQALVPETDRRINMIMVTDASGFTAEQVRADLVDAVKPYLVVSVLDKAEFASSMAAQVDQVLAILYALLGLSVVIAILGIVNTLALSIIERTREIGLMRAVGLGRMQLAGTVVIESVVIAVFGAIAGLAVGVGLASALPQIYADSGLSELVVPWAQLGWMLVAAAGVGVIAALLPAVRAVRLPVLQAVSYD